MNVQDFQNGLDKVFPNPKCELKYETDFQLLIAVILSAQCTDKRVNIVTEKLFCQYKSPQDFANAKIEDMEECIKPCGLQKNKAKAIVNASKMICERFDGVVPNDFNELMQLTGVGRKVANVMMSEAFKQDAFAVDTHVLRVSNRLKFVKTQNPTECELKLKSIFPKDCWSKLHFQMVLFGRYICRAKNPDCKNCEFYGECEYKKE